MVLLMAMMNFISHSTQHFCPTFLQQQRGFTPRMTASITNPMARPPAVAPVIEIMVTSILLALLLIPLWVLAPNLPLIALGAGRGS